MQKFDNPDVTINDAIISHAKFRAQKPAVIFGDQRLTWQEFNQRINRIANGLINFGLRKGDKVSMLMTNRLEMPEVIFGVLKAGGVIVPLSAMLPGDGLARVIKDSDSKFLFVAHELRDSITPYRADFNRISAESCFSVGADSEGWNSYSRLMRENSDEEPYVELTYEDHFNLMYTSGTTGLPKGILHTHHNRLHMMLFCIVDFRFNSSAVSLVSTPLYTNGSWIMLLPTVFCGGTLVVMPKFDPKRFLELIEKEKCTHTFMVPTQYSVLLDQLDFDQYDISSMRIWICGGSPITKMTKEEILTRFSGELVELWGMTEGPATSLQPEYNRAKTDSVGLPPMGWDVRIIDDQDRELPREEIGEIVGRSAYLMPEYYNRPDQTAKAIWLDERGRPYIKTGDVGKLDKDGFLYILDRKKDMIVSGGINVFASDIEEVLKEHPDVKDATVIGVPHSKWGETPLALVIPRQGSLTSEDEIKQWANQKLGKYQRVSLVEFRDDFPRNALGKVLKRELREPYWKE